MVANVKSVVWLENITTIGKVVNVRYVEKLEMNNMIGKAARVSVVVQ